VDGRLVRTRRSVPRFVYSTLLACCFKPFLAPDIINNLRLAQGLLDRSLTGVNSHYRTVFSVRCRYTIGSDSARSSGGSKCVHLPVLISNVLTTRLFASTKRIVRDSGCFARAAHGSQMTDLRC
jgi:hypothetical protein